MDSKVLQLAIATLLHIYFAKICYKSEASQRNIEKYFWGARDDGSCVTL